MRWSAVLGEITGLNLRVQETYYESTRLQEREQQSGLGRGDEHDKSVFCHRGSRFPVSFSATASWLIWLRLLAYGTLNKESRRRDQANMLYAMIVCITTVPGSRQRKDF